MKKPHEPVAGRWYVNRLSLQPLDGEPPYPYAADELRKVARNAYVSRQGSRYSVRLEYAADWHGCPSAAGMIFQYCVFCGLADAVYS